MTLDQLKKEAFEKYIHEEHFLTCSYEEFERQYLIEHLGRCIVAVVKGEGGS